MTTDALFCSLSQLRIAELIRSAKRAVCYAAPGIQLDLAQAMVETAGRLGKEMLTVSLDFDDRVMRMGYGDIGAVTLLLDAGQAFSGSQSDCRGASQNPNNAGQCTHFTALVQHGSDGGRTSSTKSSGACSMRVKLELRGVNHPKLATTISPRRPTFPLKVEAPYRLRP